ncbi:hypothetical protein CMI37_10450 [Candidatus Pacearchaeota archaeon]|nr:hypothetical protein [Candidatus Pacearchaeota archaeon]|tara:strand:+ start:2147 stop:2527 length:381 start_codon:yes stop_codon:yes gene_type:complete
MDKSLPKGTITVVTILVVAAVAFPLGVIFGTHTTPISHKDLAYQQAGEFVKSLGRPAQGFPHLTSEHLLVVCVEFHPNFSPAKRSRIIHSSIAGDSRLAPYENTGDNALCMDFTNGNKYSVSWNYQ